MWNSSLRGASLPSSNLAAAGGCPRPKPWVPEKFWLWLGLEAYFGNVEDLMDGLSLVGSRHSLSIIRSTSSLKRTISTYRNAEASGCCQDENPNLFSFRGGTARTSKHRIRRTLALAAFFRNCRKGFRLYVRGDSK